MRKFLILVLLAACSVVDPGERGVKVNLGEMGSTVLNPGITFLNPFTTEVWRVNVQQQTGELDAACFSADLQAVSVHVKVLYRIPEQSTIPVLRDYQGSPFDTLIVPRVQEALKEVTALKTAADIAKTREAVKVSALEAARRKIGALLIVEDLVVENLSLSNELTEAIEAKMVAQQEAEKAVYTQQRAQTEAETAVIKAQGEARAIAVVGEALEKNPRLVELKMVEKWNGVAPQVVGAGSSIMLPIASR